MAILPHVGVYGSQATSGVLAEVARVCFLTMHDQGWCLELTRTLQHRHVDEGQRRSPGPAGVGVHRPGMVTARGLVVVGVWAL